MKNTFRWEQDGAGGDNGMATFIFDDAKLTRRMYSFKEAFELSQAITVALRESFHNGRVSMLNEVARTVP